MTGKEFLLNTGLVFAAGYARKITKTIFAQLREEIAEKRIDVVEVKKAIGEINQQLYKILVERLKIDKRDVVRIIIKYYVEDGKIKFSWNDLSIEWYKKVSEENVMCGIRDVITGYQNDYYALNNTGE